MNKREKDLYEAFKSLSRRALLVRKDLILGEKATLQKEHDRLYNTTAGNYSCPTIKAKMRKLTDRFTVINKLLEEKIKPVKKPRYNRSFELRAQGLKSLHLMPV